MEQIRIVGARIGVAMNSEYVLLSSAPTDARRIIQLRRPETLGASDFGTK